MREPVADDSMARVLRRTLDAHKGKPISLQVEYLLRSLNVCHFKTYYEPRPSNDVGRPMSVSSERAAL